MSPAVATGLPSRAVDDERVTNPECDPHTAASLESPDELTEAQREYDSDPELRELLSRATSSPAVRRARHSNDRATE